MTGTLTSTSGLSLEEIETQRNFYQSHAPGCLAEFKVRPADLSGHRFDGHGEILNSYWSVACTCGSNGFKIHGYNAINPDNPDAVPVFVSPIELEFAECGRVSLLFDTDSHGYDPVACGDSFTIHGLRWKGAMRTKHLCNHNNCQGGSFSVFTRFEYPGDLFCDDRDDFRGREMDLFTWFTLVGYCRACRTRSTVVEFECA